MWYIKRRKANEKKRLFVSVFNTKKIKTRKENEQLKTENKELKAITKQNSRAIAEIKATE